MSDREASLQQQDPLAASGLTRLFALGLAVGNVVVAGAMTWLERAQVANWRIEMLALVVLALAGLLFVRAASPFRAPFRRSSFALVLAVVLTAFMLDETAQLGSNRIIHDDWGLVVVAFTLFVSASVRPPRDVLVGGLAAAGVVAGVIAAVAPFATVHVDVLPRVVVALVSVVPAALGAAVFADRALRALGEDQPVGATAPPADDVRLSVQQESIAELEAEVVPLVNRIIAEHRFSAEDGVLARELATGLRAALVADLARDWLADLGFTVTDPRGYAVRMSTEQRTTIASVLGALPITDRARPGTAVLGGQDYDAVLELTLPLARRPERSLLAPPMLLMRTVFTAVRYRTDGSTVTVTADVAIPRWQG